MNSLRDTILKAKNEREIDTLVKKFDRQVRRIGVASAIAY